jgi:hypothetical protein
MHDCEHGYACYCSGDIEDHDTGNQYTDVCECDCEEDEDGDFSCYDEGIEDEREFHRDEDDWVLACGYQGCCMPGYHFRHECHNAEDIEAMYAEHESSSQGKGEKQ